MRGTAMLKLGAALAALAAGCAAPDDRPIRNGNGGGGGNNGSGSGTGAGPDAGADGGASTTLTGTVCIASDLRTPTACTTTAPAGTVVTASGTGATTTTDAQGQFTLETGAVGGMILTVGAGSQTTVPTIVRVDVPGSQVTIPVVNANDLTGLETGLGTVVPDGMGVVALHLIDVNGAGAVGYTVTPPPGSTEGPFYDDTTAVGFTQNGGTGAAGTALLFGVPQGTFDVAVSGATTGTVSGVAVFPNAITFANGTVGTP